MEVFLCYSEWRRGGYLKMFSRLSHWLILMKNILERRKTIIIKMKNIGKFIPRMIYNDVYIMGWAKNHVVQCKKYPVSESVSFDPPAPIHISTKTISWEYHSEKNCWLLKPKLENQFVQVQTRLTQIRAKHAFRGNNKNNTTLISYWIFWLERLSALTG